MRRQVLLVMGIAAISMALCGQKALTITAPNTGGTLYLDNPYTIRWTSSGVTGNVRLVLYRGEGKVDTITSGLPASLGSWSWTVGRLHNVTEVPAGNGYRIRIVAQDEDRVSDFSDQPFVIAKLSIGEGIRAGSRPALLSLTAPNEVVLLKMNAPYSIRWMSQQVTGPVRLELRKDSGGSIIATGIPVSDGHYEWTAGRLNSGEMALPGGGYRVRITSLVDPKMTDTSEVPFALGDLHLTSPDGSRSLLNGTAYDVLWDKPGVIQSARLELLPESGGQMLIIDSCAADAGRYSWVAGLLKGGTMAPPGRNYRIRITSNYCASLTDTSQPFTLGPLISMVRPSGGTRISIGTAMTIHWWASEPVPGTRVKLTAVRQSDNREFVIRESLDNRAGDNSYRWFITTPVFYDFPGEYRIRLVSSAGIRSESNIFQLFNEDDGSGQQQIVLTQPSRGKKVVVGEHTNVEWNVQVVTSGPPVGATVRLTAVREGDNRKVVICENCPNQLGANSFSWFVDFPTFQTIPGNYRLFLRSSSGQTAHTEVFSLAQSGWPSPADQNDLEIGIVPGSLSREEEIGGHGTRGMGHDFCRVSVQLRTRNLSRYPSGAPRPEIAKVRCRWEAQRRGADYGEGSWHALFGESGSFDLGPVRSGEVTVHSVQVVFKESESRLKENGRYRILFELVNNSAINDPNPTNNRILTGDFTFKD